MNPLTPFAALVAIASAWVAPSASAKAYFAPEAVMIKTAEVIAVVEITSVEPVETKTVTEAQTLDFHERAQARVVQTLKGKLPADVFLYGDESFICAQVHYRPGRFLVFLRREGGLLTGCNWHLSVRPIKGDQVEWYTKADSIEVSWQPLDAVLEKVRQAAEAPAAK